MIQGENLDPDTNREKGVTRRHPTDDELVDQMIAALRDLKTVPKSKLWNSLTYVKKNNFASVNTFRRHFKTFDNAINKAIKKIKDDDLKIFYLDRRKQ